MSGVPALQKNDSNYLAAAYRIGRLLARLRFHGQQAWFRFPEHRQAVQAVFDDLEIAVRNTVPNEMRDELRDFIRQRRDDWAEMVDSECLAEEAYSER